MQKEIEDDFPHLPIGCSIVLEKKAKDYIIENIRSATNLNRNQLLNKIRNYRHRTQLPLTLKNFTNFYHIPLQEVYRRGSWRRLCADAGQIDHFPDTNEMVVSRAISKKWLACNSDSYFQFVLSLARRQFSMDQNGLSKEQKGMCLMLHYDVWGQSGPNAGFGSLEESIKAIGRNSV